MMTLLQVVPTIGSDLFGTSIIALVPFLCLDSKEGEVVLFRYLPRFPWVGHKLEHLSLF
jgi:hypothetical protein